MIPVVTDKAMLRDAFGPWYGLIGGGVGGHLYIDLTMDPDTPEFEIKCDELAERIKSIKGVKVQQQQS